MFDTSAVRHYPKLPKSTWQAGSLEELAMYVLPKSRAVLFDAFSRGDLARSPGEADVIVGTPLARRSTLVSIGPVPRTGANERQYAAVIGY